MARITTSIKGEQVNFDLFDIKQKMGEKPITSDVENREKFVYSKRKRGSKRTVEKMISDQHENVKMVRDAMQTQEPQSAPSATADESAVVSTEKKRRVIKKKPVGE